MKTRKSTRQERSENHLPIDTDARKLVSSVAQSHAADNDSAEHTRKLYSTVKQAREILTTLQNDYGLNPASLTTPIPSNQEITDQWKKAHNGQDPTMEETLGEAFKRARESFAGHVPVTLPPKPLPPESEIAIAPLSVPHQHALADKSWNVQTVNGVRMLEIHNGDVADTIRMTYPALRDAVKMARAWVQAKPKETIPADVRSAFPMLEIANDDEIDQHVIRLPKDKSDRFVALEMLRRHTPGNYTKNSIERMTSLLTHRKKQPIRAVQTTDSSS